MAKPTDETTVTALDDEDSDEPQEGESYISERLEKLRRERRERTIRRARSRIAKEIIARRVKAVTPCVLRWMLSVASPVAAEHPALDFISNTCRMLLE